MRVAEEEYLTYLEEDDEEERNRQLRRKKRIEEMRLKKQRTLLMHRIAMGAAVLVALLAGIGIFWAVRSAIRGPLEETQDAGLQAAGTSGKDPVDQGEGDVSFQDGNPGDEGGASAQQTESEILAFEAHSTENTQYFRENIVSEYGILIDVETEEILAARSANARMSPASMTKILTVLTAAEALGIEDGNEAVLEDDFVMTVEITDYAYVNDCYIVGFDVGETITVRDLFYGTILQSGGDAALGLAVYVSGSQEAFMELMNQKLEKLGLSATSHFANCIGIYDEAHYSTVYDMAVMLKEATDNAFCREVLSAHTYTTSLTEQHPEGISISNWFLRRIEDKDTHGEVLCGKTGFVNQSGSCAASLALDGNGREYLCVTAGSTSSWRCIYDQTELFQEYLPAR